MFIALIEITKLHGEWSSQNGISRKSDGLLKDSV